MACAAGGAGRRDGRGDGCCVGLGIGVGTVAGAGAGAGVGKLRVLNAQLLSGSGVCIAGRGNETAPSNNQCANSTPEVSSTGRQGMWRYKLLRMYTDIFSRTTGTRQIGIG